MTDEHLRENLRRLPEAGAGEGFTRAVLARLAEEPTADPGNREIGQWLGQVFRGFSLQAAGPRLAAVAAVMVVAAALALTLTQLLDHPGQPATVAESIPSTDGSPDVAGAPAERPAGPVTVPVNEALTAPAAGPVATAADPEPRRASAAIRDAAPGAAPGAVPAATDAASAADTAAPATQPRTLEPEERRRAVERLRQLRREQERLRARLAVLSEAPAPTLVLGGDESLELVLDLSADAGRTGGAGGYGALPASHRPQPDTQPYFR